MRMWDLKISQVIAFAAVCVFFFTLKVPQATADSAAYKKWMGKALSSYKKKEWDDSLEALRKALRSLRGKPAYRKATVFMYMGLSLYHLENRGLAWKAFERALYLEGSLELPANESKDTKAFFLNVKKRVNKRGGEGVTLPGKSSSTTPGAPSKGLGSAWPWALVGVGVAAVGAGVLFTMNASANQSDLDAWMAKGKERGRKEQELKDATKEVSDSIGLQSTLGLVSFIVGGLAIAGGVTLLFILPSKPKASARNTHTRQLPNFSHASSTIYFKSE